MQTQQRLLAQMLACHAASAFGRAHGFDRIRSWDEYRDRVPLRSGQDYVPWIDRIRHGEQRVLTVERVNRLMPTSGTTNQPKLVPFTNGFQRQFTAAIGPWVVDLFRRYPDLKRGPAYWSISPAIESDSRSSAVPIGFDDDSQYLGGWSKALVEKTFAVPSCVSRFLDVDQWRLATLFWLLRARELRLFSVWHPSFLDLLFEALTTHWKLHLNPS